jgi:hypothetical protein
MWYLSEPTKADRNLKFTKLFNTGGELFSYFTAFLMIFTLAMTATFFDESREILNQPSYFLIFLAIVQFILGTLCFFTAFTYTNGNRRAVIVKSICLVVQSLITIICASLVLTQDIAWLPELLMSASLTVTTLQLVIEALNIALQPAYYKNISRWLGCAIGTFRIGPLVGAAVTVAVMFAADHNNPPNLFAASPPNGYSWGAAFSFIFGVTGMLLVLLISMAIIYAEPINHNQELIKKGPTGRIVSELAFVGNIGTLLSLGLIALPGDITNVFFPTTAVVSSILVLVGGIWLLFTIGRSKLAPNGDNIAFQKEQAELGFKAWTFLGTGIIGLGVAVYLIYYINLSQPTIIELSIKTAVVTITGIVILAIAAYAEVFTIVSLYTADGKFFGKGGQNRLEFGISFTKILSYILFTVGIIVLLLLEVYAAYGMALTDYKRNVDNSSVFAQAKIEKLSDVTRSIEDNILELSAQRQNDITRFGLVLDVVGLLLNIVATLINIGFGVFRIWEKLPEAEPEKEIVSVPSS